MSPPTHRIPFTHVRCPAVFVVLEKTNIDKRGLACVAHRCIQYRDMDGCVNIYRTAQEQPTADDRIETVSFADLLERFVIVNSNGLLSPAGTIPGE